MERRAELVSELKGWCCGEALDEAHAVMVLLQEDVDTSAIEETMQTVKCLGRVRVRGRNFNMRLNRYLALCECKEAVRAENVPFDVFPIEGGGPWQVITVDEATRASTQVQMSGTQQAPGKRVEGHRPLSPGDEAAAKSTEAILRAVSDLLSKTTKSSSEHGSYRRLRTFSGLLPTPAGEEQFDHWLGQARLMVEECDCSRKEKRRRLMESLRGPALDIVNAARQQPGEKLSDFLRRLEQSLNRVVQKDGLPFGCADKARLEQLLRGAIASDLMLVNLRLRERKTKPPTFLQLLKEIRTEEEFEASRKKITPVVQSGNVRQNADVKQSDIQNLKSEIKELKALVAAVVTKPAQYTSASSETNSPNVVYSECSSDSDVAALKKQMKRLQQKVMNKVGEPQVAVSAVNTSKPVASSSQQSFKVSEEHFCYRCGESGHLARK
ncbi:paraneoplastic antigen Ma2 homolog [Alosa alosa]|uniref:paraneoplastic antigen Ma2 homolog n=1 Tax=Alosa alosa TaxID=278164 RepID=UPI0020154192|nr:paraneoplastic antigen Ma2 homolog [Alosa alosa]